MDTAEVPEPISSFIAAVNSHDEAAFLDAFTETGFVDDWGTKYNGLVAIKQWSDREFIGAKGVLTPEQVFQEFGTITVIGDWRSSYANGLSRFHFVVDGNKITSMTISEG